MKVITKLIGLWYFFLTLLALCAAITITASEIMPALFLLWAIFLCFFLGCRLPGRSYKPVPPPTMTGNKVKMPLPFIALGSIIASLYAAKFYTGNSFLEVIFGHSLYLHYQLYFKYHELAKFTLDKIPAIFSLFYLKMATLYVFISVLAISKKITIQQIFCLLLVSASTLFFSMARGTSFELFELMLLLTFSMNIRGLILNRRGLSIKVKILLLSLGALAVMMYSYNLSSRFFNFHGEVIRCATYDLCTNEEALLYQISTALGKLSYKLSGYFTFGLFYTAKFIEEFWFASFQHFISLILPFANLYDPELNARLLCKDMDCAQAWIPSIVNYILYMGVLLVLVMAFLMGILGRYLLKAVLIKQKFLEVAVLYFIFFVFISSPVGDFISVSSSNKLSILILGIGLLINKITPLISFKNPDYHPQEALFFAQPQVLNHPKES